MKPGNNNTPAKSKSLINIEKKIRFLWVHTILCAITLIPLFFKAVINTGPISLYAASCFLFGFNTALIFHNFFEISKCYGDKKIYKLIDASFKELEKKEKIQRHPQMN